MKFDIVRRLRNPPFGTETSERNIMDAAADEIERLREALRPLLEACENDFMCDVTEAGDTRDGDDEAAKVWEEAAKVVEGMIDKEASDLGDRADMALLDAAAALRAKSAAR